jgi:hypothetical protein
MHQAARREARLTLVQFGFDRERLYVRIDATRPMVDLLADGLEVSLKFLQPDGVRFSVVQIVGRLTGHIWDRQVAANGAATWVERGAGSAAAAAGTVLEIGLPLADLGVTPGDPVAFFVAMYSEGAEVERHPAHRPIEVLAPDALFEARHWRA